LEQALLVYPYLHNHSHFSLLEALPSPAELVAAAAATGIPALALTDHRYLSGAVEFALACRRSGVQPIFGLELDLAADPRPTRIVLLAMNLNGWSSLCRLSSAALMTADPDQAIPINLLASHCHDLLAIIGGSNTTALTSLIDLFPARLYLELADPDDKELLATSTKLRLPLVAARPVYTLEPDQAPLLRTLASIRLNTPLAKLPPAEQAGNIHFPPADEFARLFKDQPTALAATGEIAGRCGFDLPLGIAHLPAVPLPAGRSAAQVLRTKAEEGARHLYGDLTPVIRQRLDQELKVISQHGFEPVFLIVEELLAFARREGIIFSSRGSAASSLVAHCLGITSPDPLHHDLYFERFLNPARSTPPDIDTDICSRRRDEIIQYVFDVYGAERVAMVGTINHFRPRSALADVAKARGLPEATVRELTVRLPYGFFARRNDTDEEGSEPPSPFAELVTQQPQYRNLYAEAEALLKLPRHLSVHAGGLVVSPGAMTDLVPVMRSGSKGITITQLDLTSVEALGLVKIDLLGIRGLTVMSDVATAVQAWRSREYRTAGVVLESIPMNDPQTSARLEKGLTIGCFQIESPGMRATLREIKARTLDDLIVALSLYRPGPITGGMKDDFVRRFKGQEKVSYLHPALEPILKETFGVVMYQEQVLRLAHELAGLSLADADLLRRAMSHFDPGRQMQILKERFLAGALEKSGVPAPIAERIWELMAAFAGYGFPKAHAASYAQVAWRSAWCKTHFPAEFMAAVLANWGGYYSQRVYLSEARRLGLQIRAPHVNHSRREFSVAYPQGQAVLYMGLDQVRDLTRRTIERILQMRPFVSLEDFLVRVDPRRQEAENLAKAGALQEMGNIPALLQCIRSGEWRSNQMTLFGEQTIQMDQADWTLDQKVAAQEEILGVSLEVHPLELHADAIRQAGAVSTVEAAEHVGQHLTVAGMRMTSHRHRNSQGQWMLFPTLEDLEGMLDAILLPDVFNKYRFEVSGNQPLLATGTVEIDAGRGEPTLRVEKIERLD
jgi:DNA polymerase-3 subunit alpha